MRPVASAAEALQRLRQTNHQTDRVVSAAAAVAAAVAAVAWGHRRILPSPWLGAALQSSSAVAASWAVLATIAAA